MNDFCGENGWHVVVDICETEINEEMEHCLCEVICVAPWTSLALRREFALSGD